MTFAPLTAAGSLSAVSVSRLDFTVEPGIWTEAEAHRPAIDAHFAVRQAEHPQMWNGRVLVMRHFSVDGGTLRGRFIETDFASFLWWRDHGWSAAFNVFNAFGMAALEGSDGGFVLGEMAPWTAAAGRMYFPCGTPDLSDVTPEGVLDLESSVRRELNEETGLNDADIARDDGWSLVVDAPRVALLRRLVAHEPADVLAARIRASLAAQTDPELCAIHVVHTPADLVPAMTSFCAAYMLHRWAQRGGSAAAL